nr:3,4-dihydroxy-2-butanone-4-phosphate synthase [Lacunisphaera sp.]
DPATRSDELVQPGHVFPLCARAGGVLERAGHTEAAVDFAALAGLKPAAVICEILNEDGTMARLPELIEFKQRHRLPLVSIAQLIEYRHRREQLVEQVATRPFASEYGEFQLHIFRSKVDGRHHLAFTKGTLDAAPTLVRVHTENLLSDVFHATDMGSHRSLLASLERVAQAGHGVILYMEQTGRMQEALLSADQPAPGGAAPANLGPQMGSGFVVCGWQRRAMIRRHRAWNWEGSRCWESAWCRNCARSSGKVSYCARRRACRSIWNNCRPGSQRRRRSGWPP